jgi:hypothetical protein
MKLIKRPFWFSFGRVSVYGEPWERQKGEPLVIKESHTSLVQGQTSGTRDCMKTFWYWLPFVRLEIEIRVATDIDKPHWEDVLREKHQQIQPQ